MTNELLVACVGVSVEFVVLLLVVAVVVEFIAVISAEVEVVVDTSTPVPMEVLPAVVLNDS